MTRHPYPLQWPDGWDRTPDDQRTQSRFFYGLRESRKSLLIELERLGASDVAITSNLSAAPSQYEVDGDGVRRQVPHPSVTDPGVAVWFTLGGAERVMCCDRWLTPAENMRSIALSIEALRGLDRWGTRDVITRAFAGFTALPSGPPAEDWRHVLQLQEIITLPIPKGRDDLRAMWLAACRISYRALIKATHPDHGGNGADAARINAAMTEAERVLNRYTQQELGR